MQDDTNGLLHSGDIATDTLPAGESSENIRIVAQSILAVEDMISIKQLPPAAVQGWCLTRIAEYRDYIRLLRTLYDPAACTTIWKSKSHIRALRSQYNAFSPINHLLPPEVLFKIFSNVHPAVVYSQRLPVLHVCRYWRMLVFKTPQFWANLFTLRRWEAPGLKWRIDLFMAALTLSAPVDLTLSLPFRYHLDVVDIVVPHANRIVRLRISHIFYNKRGTEQLLEQHMPRLQDLVILDRSQTWRNPPLTLCFHNFPNIQHLHINLTLFYSPIAPCASLRHLELAYCTMRPESSSTPTRYRGPTICSVLDALELFPNLEILILINALSGGHWYMDSDLPEITKTVHLPHLRCLEIDDQRTYVSCFLSHLTFPSTTTLFLGPSYRPYA